MYEKLANRHFERSTEIRDHCKTQNVVKSVTGAESVGLYINS